MPLLIAIRMDHNHLQHLNNHQDTDLQDLHLRPKTPPDEGYNSSMDYTYDGSHSYDYPSRPTSYETGSPMQSLDFNHQPQSSTYISSQQPRSTWADFASQYGRPISPDNRSMKAGRAEKSDADLLRYKREPCRTIYDAGEEENWQEGARKYGWAETQVGLQDLLGGKIHRHELEACAPLRLLAAAQGVEISDDVATEELEGMLDEVVEARGREEEEGRGGLARSREGYGGHYVWYQN